MATQTTEYSATAEKTRWPLAGHGPFMAGLDPGHGQLRRLNSQATLQMNQ